MNLNENVNVDESGGADGLSRRLRNLDGMPVDTAGLERAVAGLIPKVAGRKRWLRVFGQLAAVAAGLIILVSVGLVMLGSNRAVMAEPAMIADVHREMVANSEGIPLTDVKVIQAEIRRQWADSPAIPNAGVKAHACCVKKMKDARMAFILLDVEKTQVTMAIAKSKDVDCPPGDVRMSGGMSWCVQKVGELTMVMTEQGTRWICLTGDLPAEKLMEIASKFVKD